MLLVDVYNKAKKLHIDIEARRVVFVIETPRDRDNNTIEIVKSIFAGRNKDIITACG